MKKQILLLIAISMTLVSVFVSGILLSGCSSRFDPVDKGEGSTLFPPKDSMDIDAEAVLYKGTDDTGRLIEANMFTMGDKSKVYATVRVLNRELHPERDVLLHIDWIAPDGNSLFMKREDLAAGDTISNLSSSISIPPDRRDPGDYKFRVYLYRELIAEKNFTLVNYDVDSAAVFPENAINPISALIQLGSSKSYNDAASENRDAVFEIKSNAKVYAGIKFINKDFYRGKEFSGYVEWTGEDGKPFYSKSFSISPFDTGAELSSAISANKKTREPGKYNLKVFLFNRLVGEKSFRLVPEKEEQVKITPVKGIDASVIFCSKVGKKTKKAYGISDRFSTEKKGRIYAVVNIIDTRIKSENSAIRLEWISPDEKSFYSKTFKFGKKNISAVLSNSISVNKERKPGVYKCRVYYNKYLIADKSFKLLP